MSKTRRKANDPGEGVGGGDKSKAISNRIVAPPAPGVKYAPDQVTYEGQKWGAVPVSAWSVPVSAEARLLFTLLWSYVNPQGAYSVWPSQSRLASQLGVTERAIGRQLAQLEAAGVLERHYRLAEDPAWSGNPAARLYHLRLPEAVSQRPTGRQRPVGPDANVLPDRTPTSAEHTKEQPNEQTNEIKTPVSGSTQPLLLRLAIEEAKRREVVNPEAYAKGMLARGWKPKTLPDPMDEACAETGYPVRACNCEACSAKRRAKYASPWTENGDEDEGERSGA